MSSSVGTGVTREGAEAAPVEARHPSSLGALPLPHLQKEDPGVLPA